MKRLLALFVTMAALFVLAACGSGEKVTLINEQQEGVRLSVTYTAKDDKVRKQTAKNEIDYTALDVKNKKEAQEVELFEEAAEEYAKTNGVSYRLDFKKDKVIEQIEVDYEKVDADELEELAAIMTADDIEDGISLKASVEFLKENGFKVVE